MQVSYVMVSRVPELGEKLNTLFYTKEHEGQLYTLPLICKEMAEVPDLVKNYKESGTARKKLGASVKILEITPRSQRDITEKFKGLF